MKRWRPTRWNGGARPRLLLVGLGLALVAFHVSAQALRCDPRRVPYRFESGTFANRGSAEMLAFSQVALAPESPAMVRLHFAGYHLGERSHVLLTSLKDGGQQWLDARTMPQWQNTSAIFNGDAVQVDLVVAPGDAGVYVRVDQLVYQAECARGTLPAAAAGGGAESLCGVDNRVASTNNGVGRINSCTAWLVSNGAVLTAGHCAPPGGVFEVNVPPSLSNGTPVAAHPNDQFPINLARVTYINGGEGNDYCVFGLLPNSNTGQRAHVLHPFFRMSRETPPAGATIRVTGFGVDNSPVNPPGVCCAYDSLGACTYPNCNADNRTQQTSTGGYAGEMVNSAMNAVHTHRVDTEPANSGSPMIWEAFATNQFTIGIHTHGGCNPDGSGENSGTSFEHDGLEATLQTFPGGSTVYLDVALYPNSPTPNGLIFQPFKNLPAAAAVVPSAGRISIVRGTYPKPANTGVFGADGKAMLLEAPVGSVTFGE